MRISFARAANRRRTLHALPLGESLPSGSRHKRAGAPGVRHFVCWPSVKVARALACAELWLAKGYDVLVMLDKDQAPPDDNRICWMNCSVEKFPGYYKVANEIARKAFAFGADLVTMIGDDMDPPEQGAEAVAAMYFARFPDGFGVLQGCGDTQGMENGVPASARICGSPTFGEGWANRAYGGKGPFCDEYTSFYGDEDLWNVAKKCGVLLLEPSVTIFHRHWSFGHMQKQKYQQNNEGNWALCKATFERRVGPSRQNPNFPGWEPCASS